MNSDFAFIGLMTAIALIFPVIPLILARLVSPKKPGPMKNATYECGLEVTGDSWIQFRVQYYIFALIFVLFDVGGVFLFPFAVAYNSLPLYTVAIITVFILTLLGSLLYAWRKGVLQWD